MPTTGPPDLSTRSGSFSWLPRRGDCGTVCGDVDAARHHLDRPVAGSPVGLANWRLSSDQTSPHGVPGREVRICQRGGVARFALSAAAPVPYAVHLEAARRATRSDAQLLHCVSGPDAPHGSLNKAQWAERDG